MVILLKYPAVPNVVPSDNITAVATLAPFTIIQFFKVVLAIGTVVPTAPIHTTVGAVTLVLVMVRFLLVLPLFEPSIITLLENILINPVLANVPVKVDVVNAAGLMVSVNGPPHP